MPPRFRTHNSVTIGQLYTVGLIAGGIAGTSFTYLDITIANERQNGVLRRLAATPMPRAAYFAGKVIQVTLCAIAETALLLAAGVAFYHVRLPAQASQWLTFAWVFLLGEYLDLAVATARENPAEGRALVAALAPAGLEDAGLAGAVARASDATGTAAGIEATCAAEGNRYRLPTATGVVLLRVCQEAPRHRPQARGGHPRRRAAALHIPNGRTRGRGQRPGLRADRRHGSRIVRGGQDSQGG
jgi:hypothetical protein